MSTTIKSNGATYLLSSSGVLEQVNEAYTNNNAFLESNPVASSLNRTKPVKHPSKYGLVGLDVHGSGYIPRARL